MFRMHYLQCLECVVNDNRGIIDNLQCIIHNTRSALFTIFRLRYLQYLECVVNDNQSIIDN